MAVARIFQFDTWRAGYGLATVNIYQAGTSTLADVFSDEALTVAAANPQTLIERVEGGISYGKFQEPLYCGVPYELSINSVDTTGVSRPALTTLEGEDASESIVTVDGGSEAISLAEHLARQIDVRDFGEFLAVGEVGASTSTNTTTLAAAIGAAAGRGGSVVNIPAGTYQISTITVPASVILSGSARDATILQSIQAGTVVLISGDNGGLSQVTIDGISLVGSSVGVKADDIDRIVLDDVLIKRFETGIELDGGIHSHWRNLTVSNCDTGFKGYATDADLSFNTWRGGGVELCSVVGIDLRYDGETCVGNSFHDLFLDTNTGIAVRLEGALATSFRDCDWVGNTTNLTVLDESDDNPTIGLDISGGSISEGAISLTGRLENVAFRRVRMSSVAVTITTPSNTILVEDCEQTSVSVGGDATSWLLNETSQTGGTFGLTTGNVATKAWAITLDPGEQAYLEAKVNGRQIDAEAYGFYHIAVSARRPGATLDYDTQTGNFTAGNTITGATSGATARIQADSDSGTTGTLTLIDVVGDFVDDEIITDGFGGSATVNGTISTSDAVLVGSVTELRAAQETVAAWDATFVANGPQIELRVTGDTSDTVEWVSQVTVSR